MAKYTREQRWARVPVDLCVLTCFPVQHFLRSPVLPPFCFAFLYTRSVCVGVGEQLVTRALCVYGLIRRAGSTRHCATNPLVSHTRCTSLLAGSRFGVKLASCPQSPPSTSPLSTRHNCVISSQERIFIVPILSRSAFPRSCIKCAFPRARVPKIPGPRECGNAKPGTSAHLCQGV